VCIAAAAGATSCVFDSSPHAAAAWPAVPSALVSVGGVTVTCGQALAAVAVLESSGASAIQAVLRAAGSPLAACDYHAVYRPGYERARQRLAVTGRSGARGRHVAKAAFGDAVRAAVAAAACDAFRRALGAIAADERYAMAIARDAVAVLARRGLPAASVLLSDGDECCAWDAIAA
jgi:hypothetical protein